ncbi:PHP domain-containing protein [Saliniradius amylolyticus]|nr:PHP domain-containing protein [Saliniradius amylolyticus]
MKIDLHSHTHYSDGSLSPEELVLRAHNHQLDVLAITDHDSTAGLEEAQACQAGQKRSLQLIPGVEISTRWHGFDIHVLGLNIDPAHPVLTQRLAEQSERRDERAQKIGEKLAKMGFESVYEDAVRLAGVGQVTRAHFARALINAGIVSDFDAAFRRYLGKGKRAHVTPQWPEIPEAIDWIHAAGGDAVLAHPARYDLSAKWLRRLIVYFKDCGGDGLEVLHPGLSPDRRRQMASYAREYDLKASAGSDFHHPSRWTELGKNLSFAEDLVPIWQNWSIN